MKKNILTIALLTLSFVLSGCSTKTNSNQQIDINNQINQTITDQQLPIATTTSTNDQTVIAFVTKEELAKHNSENDCWVGFDGQVYDVTSYLPKHPGGTNQIAPYCGSVDEFKKAFIGQHGLSKVAYLKMMPNKGELK